MTANKIVFIMTDSQGADKVGCYGRPELKTPCLDKLADQGIRFDRAYTAQPVCGPARAAIFTGTYPHTNGVLGNCSPKGDNIRTIGQRFADNGFHTAYMGKWHLDGTDYFGNGICPPGWDSDYWYDIRNYLEELTPEERVRWRQELGSREAIHKYGITEEDTYAHRCSNRAIDFLGKHAEESFFLSVSYDEPHGPCTCPPPFCDMFVDFEYAVGDNVRDTLSGKPEHQREWAAQRHGNPNMRSFKRPMYFGCNAFVDYEIGRVLDAVTQYAPDALVIYTSDHGHHDSAHRLQGKGPTMYEEIVRIPFIMRWPGQSPENAVCSHPISHVDIVPTVLAAAGLDVPPHLEGTSLLETFRDPGHQPQDAIFMEFNRFELDHDGMGGFQPIRCVFDGRHKLVINLHTTDELYDLHKDPGEMSNLIDSVDHAEIRDGLHDQLLNWLNRTRDPLRGAIWERRPWRTERCMGWGGPTRPRPDDGYEPGVLLYRTGLPVDKREY